MISFRLAMFKKFFIILKLVQNFKINFINKFWAVIIACLHNTLHLTLLSVFELIF